MQAPHTFPVQRCHERITERLRADLHPIAIADPPLRSSYGLHAPFALRTIVELKTDSGLTGISETYGGRRPAGGAGAVRPRVIGMDPFQLAGLWQDLSRDAEQVMAAAPGGRSQTYLVPGENPLDRHARTFAAIEIACLDLIGKAVGKPVCDVIGGRVRDASASRRTCFISTAAAAASATTRARTSTARCSDPQACVRECRQMIGAVRLPRDQAQGRRARSRRSKSPASARCAGSSAPRTRCASIPTAPGASTPRSRVGRALKDELPDGGYLEDPCATLEGMAEVRRRLLAEGNDTPQASNVAVTCFADVPRGQATRRRADRALATRTTGAACARCSTFRT